MPPPATPVTPVTPALVVPAPSPQSSSLLSSILSYEQTLRESSISSEGDDSQRNPDFKPAGARVQVNLDEEVDQLVDDNEELVPVTRELFLPNLFDSANISLATPARTRQAQPRTPSSTARRTCNALRTEEYITVSVD